MIVISGATGHLGRAIVDRLVLRIPVREVGVSVRDPSKASDLAALGVRVREGDFSKPASLVTAFEGASQVLIVSSNAARYGGDPLAQHRAAIDAARAAGASRVVYTSHMAASATSLFAPMHDHAATEAMLRESGLAWTSLRNGFYASSGIEMMGGALQSGTMAAPPDGKVTWTAHADLAEAAAVVLSHPGRFEGPTPPLVGSESLDFADLAKIASEVVGRPIERKVVSETELEGALKDRGTPPVAIRIALGFYRASAHGEFASADTTLSGLIARSPTGMRDAIAASLGAGSK